MSEGSRSDAGAKASQYPVGTTVQVYYNPDDPAQAALNLGAPFNWTLAFVRILLIAVMAFVWVTVGNPGFTSGLTK